MEDLFDGKTLRKNCASFKGWLFQINYFRLHFAYFIFWSLLGGLVLWGLEKNDPLPFIDSLYIAVSALTCTGLNTYNTQLMRLDSQVFMVFLMMFGGAVFRSIFPVIIRRRSFVQSVKRIKQTLGEEKVKTLSKRLRLELQSLNLLMLLEL